MVKFQSVVAPVYALFDIKLTHNCYAGLGGTRSHKQHAEAFFLRKYHNNRCMVFQNTSRHCLCVTL